MSGEPPELMQEAWPPAFRGPSLASARAMLAGAATSAVSREQWERAVTVVACAVVSTAQRVGTLIVATCSHLHHYIFEPSCITWGEASIKTIV